MADEAQPKVVSLRGGEIIPPGEPKPNVISLAERLLEMAVSGELSALSVVRTHADGSHTYEHTGPISYGLIGTLECFKQRLAEDQNVR